MGASMNKTKEGTALNGEGNKSSKVKNDIIFIAVLLTLILIIGSVYILSRGEGNTVTVTVDGEFFGEYSLSVDQTVEIKTDKGTNILIINGGKARIAEASCPDGVCVSHRAISRDGESIICLPNKVVVTVSISSEDTPDIIV
jgi:hypothetical protein